MKTVGPPEIMAILAGLVALGFYGVIFFVLWKFYQMFSKMNDNLAGIRQALDRNAGPPST